MGKGNRENHSAVRCLLAKRVFYGNRLLEQNAPLGKAGLAPRCTGRIPEMPPFCQARLGCSVLAQLKLYRVLPSTNGLANICVHFVVRNGHRRSVSRTAHPAGCIYGSRSALPYLKIRRILPSAKTFAGAGTCCVLSSTPLAGCVYLFPATKTFPLRAAAKS